MRLIKILDYQIMLSSAPVPTQVQLYTQSIAVKVECTLKQVGSKAGRQQRQVDIKKKASAMIEIV